MPTLEDVAARAGVSRATASRVVNANPRVGESARHAVTAAVAELGYRPNRAARALVIKQPDSIAVVFPEADRQVFADPFFSWALAGVTEALRETTLQMVLLMGAPGDVDRRIERYLRGGQADGAILVPHQDEDNLRTVLAETRLPAVFLGRPHDPTTDVPHVEIDDAGGAYQAVTHLIERGRRRIAVISGPLTIISASARLEGWRQAVQEAGMSDDLVETTDDSTPEGAIAALRSLMATADDIDALLVTSDRMAAAVVGELLASGRSVPGDVAVVGYDDDELASLCHPHLTTVVNPVSLMATRAVEMLRELMEGGQVTSQVLPTTLVVRESS